MGLNHSSSKSAKLYDAKGNFLRKLKLPLRVAELMLEEQPGHVICPVHEILRTGRFNALRAEDDVLGRLAYLVVPFCKVNHKVSESDMKLIKLGCCNKDKKKRSWIRNKVVPEMEVESMEEEQKVVFEAFESRIKDTDFVQLKGYRRGWTPVLESIAEDPRRRRV